MADFIVALMGLILAIIVVMSVFVLGFVAANSVDKKLVFPANEWSCTKQVEETHNAPMIVGKTILTRQQTQSVCVEYKKLGGQA